MSEDNEELRFPNSTVVALSEEEWNERLPENIELSISKIGETYSDYLRKLNRIFGFVCMGHHHQPKPLSEAAREQAEEVVKQMIEEANRSTDEDSKKS